MLPAGSEDIDGSFAHARAFYRAAVEALAVTDNERAAAAASRSSSAVAVIAAGGDGAELPMTRALRSWATMESYLRCGTETCCLPSGLSAVPSPRVFKYIRPPAE